MKLDKNGYQSEKSDSFATAVKMLTFIFGLGVIVAAVCVYAMFSGCGSGGSGSGEPVYDENGNCTGNCGNGDGYVSSSDNGQPSGDTPLTYADGKPIPQQDTEPYVCPVKEPPEICTPKEAEEARCIFYDYKTDSNPDCDLSQTDHCWCSGGFYDQVDCSSQSFCQKVPPDKYPPCVCWGLPCLLVGKWDCDGYLDDLTDLEFYDNGDGYCRIHDPSDPNDDLYYKPDGDHLQTPPSGPAEQKYTFLDGGSQIQAEGPAGPFNCTKMVEE